MSVIISLGLLALIVYGVKKNPSTWSDAEDRVAFFLGAALIVLVTILVGLIFQALQPTPEKLRRQAEGEVWGSIQLPNGHGVDGVERGDGSYSLELLPFGDAENGKRCTSFVSWDGSRYVTVRDGETIRNVSPWSLTDFRWDSGDGAVGRIEWKTVTESVPLQIVSVDGSGNASISTVYSFNTYHRDAVISGVPDVSCGWDDYPSLKGEVVRRVDARYEELLGESGL